MRGSSKSSLCLYEHRKLECLFGVFFRTTFTLTHFNCLFWLKQEQMYLNKKNSLCLR